MSYRLQVLRPHHAPWRLLASLQTCLWAVLVLCLGNAFGSIPVESAPLHLEETHSFRDSAEDGRLYLRARWMDPNTGRFASEDPYRGNPSVPSSLHKYLYANSSPVFFGDPSGLLAEKWWFIRGILVHDYIAQTYCSEYGSVGGFPCIQDYQLAGVAGRGAGGYGYVDVLSFGRNEFYEIKSSTMAAVGALQVIDYQEALLNDPRRNEYEGIIFAGKSWPVNKVTINWRFGGSLEYWRQEDGLILYNLKGDRIWEYQWSMVSRRVNYNLNETENMDYDPYARPIGLVQMSQQTIAVAVFTGIAALLLARASLGPALAWF